MTFPEKQLLSHLRNTLTLSLVYSFAACVYYGFVEPPITTVAHGCAVVLGVSIAVLFDWRLCREKQSENDVNNDKKKK